MKKYIVVLSIFVLSTQVYAADQITISAVPKAEYARTKASGEEIVTDLLLVRPLLLCLTVAGTAGYVVSLPFTLIGKNAKHAGKVMVVTPVKATFTYPLGAYFNEED